MHVSKSWAALESIFLASADIRSQLPEDTKVRFRFTGMDARIVGKGGCVVLGVTVLRVCMERTVCAPTASISRPPQSPSPS